MGCAASRWNPTHPVGAAVTSPPPQRLPTGRARFLARFLFHSRSRARAPLAAAAALAALRSRHTAAGSAPSRTPSVGRARPGRVASIGNNIVGTTTRTRIVCRSRIVVDSTPSYTTQTLAKLSLFHLCT